MPNPKTSTLIKTEADAKNFATDTTVIKTEKKAPVAHIVVGKVSQKDAELIANIGAVLEVIGKNMLVSASLCTSMSPSIKIAV